MAQIDRATSRFLDATRWSAALAVVISHVSALAVVSSGSAVAPGPGLQLLYFMQNSGHLAVVIFFVVSGYLVGGQEWLRVIDGKPFDPTRYAIQRFSRIYTVLLPALLMTLAFDTLGQTAFDASQIYTQPTAQSVGSLMYPIADRGGLGTFIGNVLMLQTILVEPLGGNGPLWSLANEWWYYVVFGLALLAADRQQAAPRRAVAGVAALALLAVLPASIGVWFLIWLLGVGLALLGRAWRGLPYRASIGVMLAGFGVALLGMYNDGRLAALPGAAQMALRLGNDAVAASAFGVALLGARSARPGRTTAGTLHQRLAAFSYTLYAVHFPALVLIGAISHDAFGIPFAQPLGAASLLWVAAVSALICLYAWCFAAITERQTPLVRAALTRGWLRLRAAA